MRLRHIPGRHVLQILPKDDTVSSDITQDLVISQIDPMNAEVALRGVRKTPKGSMLVFTSSTVELEKVRTEVEKVELAKNYLISVSGRRNPEIVMFGSERISLGQGYHRQSP